MPVDKDLKNAYRALYDDHDAPAALKLCDAILKQYPGNLMAFVYKASSLEKLYYGSSEWHNDQALENARDLLGEALKVAQARGDRSKIGLVYFRHFVHYFNDKQYEKANEFMQKCKEFGYKDDTLPMWELQLNKKLQKLAKKASKDGAAGIEVSSQIKPVQQSKIDSPGHLEAVKLPVNEPKFRTDWYQTATGVVISLFTTHLPRSKDDVQVQVSSIDPKQLEVSFRIPETDSEFQYSVTLAHEVEATEIHVKVLTKKIEIALLKLHKGQWKNLESQESSDTATSSSFPSTTKSSTTLNYPSSSKKQIDWSKVDFDDNGDSETASADAFFQNLYAGADPDTKRAMMKSFIESNGTALNTNWEDVSKKKVETSPPEGMQAKDWQ